MSNILFVCTANICRSPAAEAMARSRFGDRHNFASAGFLFEGREIEPEMRTVLAATGVDVVDHVSRIITPEGAEAADLVLTMESRHVQDIAVMSPELYLRTLPLKEAAQRISRPRTPVSEVVAALAGRDPLTYLDGRWDVADPYKRSRRKYKKAVAEISELVDGVVGSLVSG